MSLITQQLKQLICNLVFQVQLMHNLKPRIGWRDRFNAVLGEHTHAQLITAIEQGVEHRPCAIAGGEQLPRRLNF